MAGTDGRPRLSDAEARELLAFAHTLADAAGAVIKPLFRSAGTIDNKRAADFDPVTAADRDAEAAMRDLIAARYPDHAVYGEEHGAEWGERFTWVLDPLDGTRSFIGVTVTGPESGPATSPPSGELEAQASGGPGLLSTGPQPA